MNFRTKKLLVFVKILKGLVVLRCIKPNVLAGRAYQDHRSYLPEDPPARFFRKEAQRQSRI
jgi:hypothetical protein